MLARRAQARSYLHSTMFLLNLPTFLHSSLNLTYLHSTMFLLNVSEKALLFQFKNLHSTMFLLNPQEQKLSTTVKRFTFHNVSIKPLYRQSWENSQTNLYSTMFLLNPGIARAAIKKIRSIYIPQCFY